MDMMQTKKKMHENLEKAWLTVDILVQGRGAKSGNLGKHACAIFLPNCANFGAVDAQWCACATANFWIVTTQCKEHSLLHMQS